MQLYHVCFVIKTHPESEVILCSCDTMPQKTKGQRQLACARAGKLAKSEEQYETTLVVMMQIMTPISLSQQKKILLLLQTTLKSG